MVGQYMYICGWIYLCILMLCCGFLCFFFFFITLLSLGTCVCTVFLEYKEEAEKLQTKTKVSLQKLNEVNSVIFFFFWVFGCCCWRISSVVFWRTFVDLSSCSWHVLFVYLPNGGKNRRQHVEDMIDLSLLIVKSL